LRKTGKCWGERNTHRHWVVARRSADDVAQDLIQRIVLALGATVIHHTLGRAT